MAFWGNGKPLLEQLASEAEAIITSMPEAERAQALEGLGHIIRGARELFELPEALVGKLWRALVWFIAQTNIPVTEAGKKARARELVLQMVAGAPGLLGAHKESIEAFLG